MQDIIRAIIEAAPTWLVGLWLVVGIRLLVRSVAYQFFNRGTRSQREAADRASARIDELPKDVDALGRLKDVECICEEEGATGWYPLALFAVIVAILAFALWVYVSVWAVVAASAPGVLAQSFWWMGVALATFESLLAIVRVRRDALAKATKLPKGWFVVAAVFWLPAAVVYAFAPLGVLAYTVGAIVFIRIERAIWSHFRAVGSTPTMLMFF